MTKTATVTGRSIGLLVCTRCRATIRTAPDLLDASSRAMLGAMPQGGSERERKLDERPARLRCPRCGAFIHERKPNSVAATAALVVSAALLYVPANVLPVMHTHTLFDEEDDTIMSGVISLFQEGSWPLALLVFVASIVVPLLKLLAMGWLLLAVSKKIPGNALQRSRLFRFVEFIGRWSMLDVYAISVIVALVQIRSLAFVRAGLGALAFCSVVVLTMIAAQTFDERLLWDFDPDG